MVCSRAAPPAECVRSYLLPDHVPCTPQRAQLLIVIDRVMARVEDLGARRAPIVDPEIQEPPMDLLVCQPARLVFDRRKWLSNAFDPLGHLAGCRMVVHAA